MDGWRNTCLGCGGLARNFLEGATLLKLCDESVCIQRPTLNHVNLEGMLSGGCLSSQIVCGKCLYTTLNYVGDASSFDYLVLFILHYDLLE